jgi:hypothetical protein
MEEVVNGRHFVGVLLSLKLLVGGGLTFVNFLELQDYFFLSWDTNRRASLKTNVGKLYRTSHVIVRLLLTFCVSSFSTRLGRPAIIYKFSSIWNYAEKIDKWDILIVC